MKASDLVTLLTAAIKDNGDLETKLVNLRLGVSTVPLAGFIDIHQENDESYFLFCDDEVMDTINAGPESGAV